MDSDTFGAAIVELFGVFIVKDPELWVKGGDACVEYCKNDIA